MDHMCNEQSYQNGGKYPQEVFDYCIFLMQNWKFSKTFLPVGANSLDDVD